MQQYQKTRKQFKQSGEAPERFKDVLKREDDQEALCALDWYNSLGVSMTFAEMTMSEVGDRGRYHRSTLRQWRHRYRLGQDAEVIWGSRYETAKNSYPPKGSEPKQIDNPLIVIPESFIRPAAFLVVLDRGSYNSED